MAARHVVRGGSFHLHYGQLVEGSEARLGFIVPKRLARTAVLRNAIKRQGREAFRLWASEVPPRDLVLRLSRPLDASEAGDGRQKMIWRSEIEQLLKRLPGHS